MSLLAPSNDRCTLVGWRAQTLYPNNGDLACSSGHCNQQNMPALFASRLVTSPDDDDDDARSSRGPVDDDDDVYYSKGRRPREDEEGEESYEKRRQWPGRGG